MAGVAKFRIDSVAALARQMTFAPHDTRAAQVAAAEELLHHIDPAKAYPLEFVVFRITGYRPRTAGEDLLTGIALQHDLGLLVEQVSDTLGVRTASLGEPVLSIDDVTERFNVTSKTIQRWRRKGLPARRFVFPDGKRRVGFLVGSVERFFAGHREQVVAGMNFSQLGDAERDEVLRRAKRLAVHCGCCATSIARRIGRKLNRSPATILHTIRKHDQERPAQAIFASAAEPLGDEERTRILRGHRRGLALGVLSRRACRSRQAVYRVLLEERIAKLTKRKVKFVDDPLYHAPDADRAVAEMLAAGRHGRWQGPGDRASGSRRRACRATCRRTSSRSTARRCFRPPRERALFLAFNYHKCRFVTARRRLEPELARARDLAELEGHLRRATGVKNAIVQANLRLVVSVARKHLRPGLSLMELVSDGNMTLMRAVESFDAHKGYRFSTYATFALMKGFARSVPEMLAGRHVGTGGGGDRGLADVPDARTNHRQHRLLDREQVDHLLSRLDDRERHVVVAHFGLSGDADGPATYEQVGERLGLSKQRVRQIEQSALAKLRAVVPPPVN
jgi:RNA polymerase sigma factor (sigma-70 family)